MGKHRSVIFGIVKNPYIQLVVGLILLSTVLLDSVLDVQHSIMLLAVWHIAQALPNILQALERIDRIETHKKDTDEIHKRP